MSNNLVGAVEQQVMSHANAYQVAREQFIRLLGFLKSNDFIIGIQSSYSPKSRIVVEEKPKLILPGDLK